jgi:hypothetical protein
VAGHKKVTKNWKRNWYIFGPFLFGGEIYQHQFFEIRILHTIGTYIIHIVYENKFGRNRYCCCFNKGTENSNPSYFLISNNLWFHVSRGKFSGSIRVLETFGNNLCPAWSARLRKYNLCLNMSGNIKLYRLCKLARWSVFG